MFPTAALIYVIAPPLITVAISTPRAAVRAIRAIRKAVLSLIQVAYSAPNHVRRLPKFELLPDLAISELFIHESLAIHSWVERTFGAKLPNWRFLPLRLEVNFQC